jgi:hypothetical protein
MTRRYNHQPLIDPQGLRHYHAVHGATSLWTLGERASVNTVWKSDLLRPVREKDGRATCLMCQTYNTGDPYEQDDME